MSQKKICEPSYSAQEVQALSELNKGGEPLADIEARLAALYLAKCAQRGIDPVTELQGAFGLSVTQTKGRTLPDSTVLPVVPESAAQDRVWVK